MVASEREGNAFERRRANGERERTQRGKLAAEMPRLPVCLLACQQRGVRACRSAVREQPPSLVFDYDLSATFKHRLIQALEEAPACLRLFTIIAKCASHSPR